MRKATLERHHPAGLGGTQRIYRFGNGYGASVVQFCHSYGDDNYSLAYDTAITNDVIGYLQESDVDKLLARIEALPAPSQA